MYRNMRIKDSGLSHSAVIQAIHLHLANSVISGKLLGPIKKQMEFTFLGLSFTTYRIMYVAHPL